LINLPKEAKVRLKLSERKAVTKELKKKYKSSSKKGRGEILDWLVEVAGYNRNYAARLLRGKVKSTYVHKSNKVELGVKASFLSLLHFFRGDKLVISLLTVTV